MHELMETLIEDLGARMWRRAPRRVTGIMPRSIRPPRGPRLARRTYVPVRPQADVGLLAF